MVLDGTGPVYDDTGWYLISISWYCLVLGGTWSAKGLYACIYWKKWRFGRVLQMPDIPQTTEYRATQLVSSIKFKLSHATYYTLSNFVHPESSLVLFKLGTCLLTYFLNHSQQLCVLAALSVLPIACVAAAATCA